VREGGVTSQPGFLGAVLAGGRSSRFGSDKALAELGGHTLLALAVDALSGCCEQVVVVGRETAPAPTLPDWPHPGMGPLGGLAAALHLARDEGYDAVLTIGVDCVGLPDDLPARLSPGPSHVADLPVIGLWPASASETLDALLKGDGSHSMRAFAEAIGARAVALSQLPANVNTPADLAAITGRSGKP
jgi:molybdopterin-guanine dinucleotide biosynthesis protein A